MLRVYVQLAESRGNGYDYQAGGRDTITSSLHWGPSKDLDRYYKTFGTVKNPRSDYSEAFHTYSLEWTPDYLITCELRGGRSILCAVIDDDRVFKSP
jgi:hypothetical protein